MKKMFVFGFIFVVAFMLVSNPFTTEYLSNMKGSSFSVSKPKDSLFQEIVLKSEEYEVPPSDAKIDPIWKAIPGYNGLKVDAEASYKKMKSSGEFVEDKLVFRQIKPKVHLDELPPAPVYKGHPDKPMVSFIINVAWGNEYLSEMLATLKSHHIKATFFLEGRWVQKNPELAKLIADAGHEVGNHSFTHPDLKVSSTTKIRQEIMRTNEVIKATTGLNPEWFAPPSGSFRDEVISVAAEEKMGTIMWSVDTVDWQKPSPDVLINRVMSKVHNGAIILMHPTSSTAKSLDQLIVRIKGKGLQIDTITELLNEDRIMENFPEGKIEKKPKN
ncbi:polysaccharide deacetylase family protein [Bacillus tuaregi]|uniref:polysaccharide deacetylase family protein n=1 Tax=Bacillus tuaregi TaxID=1816695 RepID=UPI0008F80BE5|nr:polysaccharide deacetylase family protein [Bacillus tuaregi]